MRRFWWLAPLAVLLTVAALLTGGESLPTGKYRKKAAPKKLTGWKKDLKTKFGLMPPLVSPPPSQRKAPDFSGTYRFGSYDYDIVIEQKGDQVTFRSAGVDEQDIGGAFETFGAGVVEKKRIRARWWCVDLSRNYANTGGAEIWFHEGDRDRIYVQYYHDADEKIEEGYGVREGTHAGERLHYRIRIKQPTRKLKRARTLRGSVRGRDGEALDDAVVMLRHDEKSAVRTDAQGRFALRLTRLPAVLMVSAAAPGYRTQVLACLLYRVRDLHFVLDASPYTDDSRYEFLSSTPNRGDQIWNCGNCHKNSYAEWKDSRHALSAKNLVTQAVYRSDFLPALQQGTAAFGDEGLCSACHAPQAALDGKTARLDRIDGVAAEGNHCDFCHKVHHTEDPGAAGVRGSLMLGRPAPDDESVPGPIKRTYGPLADSDYLFMGPVYNPFFKTSALCAGCHQYTTPLGVPALDTYTEWRAWAAGQKRHESCQTCHMPTGVSMEGNKLARRICVNALRRPQEQIHDHSFAGRELATTAVAVEAKTRITGDRLEVVTTVRAENTGHKLPTGSGDKHLILVVLAGDGVGRPYALKTGPRVPAHAGGEGDPTAEDATGLRKRVEAGDFAAMPGREFAQVLADKDGQRHVPFWRAVKVVEDTRLEPDRPVTVRHLFDVSGDRPVRVRVELYHRLRFKAHDVARGLKGPGVRPLDLLIGRVTEQAR